MGLAMLGNSGMILKCVIVIIWNVFSVLVFGAENICLL